jgi:hypothetical protein
MSLNENVNGDPEYLNSWTDSPQSPVRDTLKNSLFEEVRMHELDPVRVWHMAR